MESASPTVHTTVQFDLPFIGDIDRFPAIGEAIMALNNAIAASVEVKSDSDDSDSDSDNSSDSGYSDNGYSDRGEPWWQALYHLANRYNNVLAEVNGFSEPSRLHLWTVQARKGKFGDKPDKEILRDMLECMRADRRFVISEFTKLCFTYEDILYNMATKMMHEIDADRMMTGLNLRELFKARE